MEFYALILILIEKYFRGKRNACLMIGTGAFIITLLGWILSFQNSRYVVEARMTIGQYMANTTNLSYLPGIFLPVAVYCFIKASVKRTKVFPLIPVLAISFIVSLTSRFIVSIIQNALVNGMFSGNTNPGLQAVIVIIQLLNGVIVGFCAVSWIQYIRFNPVKYNQEKKETDLLDDRHSTSYPYLDEYKKRLKDGM